MGAVSVYSHENRQVPQYVCGGQIQIVSLGASVFIQWSRLADPMIVNFKAYNFHLLCMGLQGYTSRRCWVLRPVLCSG